MNPVEQIADTANGSIDVIAIWRVLWKYRYVIALFTGVFGAVAVYIALTAVPGYRAEVSIAEVSPTSGNSVSSLTNQIGGLASLVGVNLGNGAGGNNREYEALLRSRHLADRKSTRLNSSH